MSGVDHALNGNHESAIELFNESLFLWPRYPVYFERGCAHLETEDWGKAVDDFDRVQWPALGDGNAFLCAAACNGRGIARRMQHRYIEAVDDFRSALAYYSMLGEPDDEVDASAETAASNLIVALMEIEDYQTALLYARKALEIGHDPSSPSTLK